MSDEAMAILSPDEQVFIRRGSARVTVCELTWKEARTMIQKVAGHAGAFLSYDEKGAPQIDNSKLIGVMMTNLGEELVAACTKQPPEWVDSLSPVDMAVLLEKAVALNIHPEMIVAVGNVVARVRTLTSGTATSR